MVTARVARLVQSFVVRYCRMSRGKLIRSARETQYVTLIQNLVWRDPMYRGTGDRQRPNEAQMLQTFGHFAPEVVFTPRAQACITDGANLEEAVLNNGWHAQRPLGGTESGAGVLLLSPPTGT